MKAFVITDAKAEPQTQTAAMPTLGERCNVLVKIKAAALNRRDYFISKGMYSKIQYPVILGSDGCGVVVKGPDEWLGREVVFNPSFDWGNNPKAQSDHFSILGMPLGGTIAEYIALPADRLHLKPAHLNSIQAAAAPLAGVTAYRALLTQGGATAGQKILVTGGGGGVAMFAIQFAAALGAKAFCTSSSDEKIENIIKIGAAGGANYRAENWDKKLLDLSDGGFDLIIDGAGGDQINALLSVCKPGGSIISYGATLGTVNNLNMHRIFWKQIRLQGSTMGSDSDFAAMLSFIAAHKIIPIADSVFSLDNAGAALALMERGEQFGKIVIKAPAH